MELTPKTVDTICRALLAIVAALQEAYDLPKYKNITLEVRTEIYSEPTITPVIETKG